MISISKIKISILLLVAIACPSFAQEQYTYKYPKTYPILDKVLDAFGKSKFMCQYNDYLIKNPPLYIKKEYEQYSYPASPEVRKIGEDALRKARISKDQLERTEIYENDEMSKFNILGYANIGRITLLPILKVNHHLAKIYSKHEANHIRYNDLATSHFMHKIEYPFSIFCGVKISLLTSRILTYYRPKLKNFPLLTAYISSSFIIGTLIGMSLHRKLSKYHAIHIEDRSDENALDQNNCYKCTYKFARSCCLDYKQGQQLANRGYRMHDKVNAKGKEQEKKGLLCEDCKDTPILDIPKQPQTLAEQIKSKLTSSFS